LLRRWDLEDFWYGDIACQIIKFKISGLQYVMVFNRIDAVKT
jgi:hypothetical protein